MNVYTDICLIMYDLHNLGFIKQEAQGPQFAHLPIVLMMEKRNESMKGNSLVLHAKFGPNLEGFFFFFCVVYF